MGYQKSSVDPTDASRRERVCVFVGKGTALLQAAMVQLYRRVGRILAKCKRCVGTNGTNAGPEGAFGAETADLGTDDAGNERGG